MPSQQFRHVKKIEDARRRFFDAIQVEVKGVDSIRLQDAVGRILARPVISRRYLPASDLAVVDGYAVRSADLRKASSETPGHLQLVGESNLGEACHLKIRKGQTVALATGSTIPRGGDAVVMVENVRRLHGNKIEFQYAVSPCQGIMKRGEDIAPGRLVLDRGSRLRPEDVGALKTLGLKRVQVVRRVQVGVLSTGNELVDSPRKNDRTKIVDLNRPILSAMLRELEAEPVDLGIVKDDERGIRAALRTGLAKTDLVLVTAGSSVGKRDLVPDCINNLGKPGMLIHGVAMRPAMPTGLAVVRGKPVVSLPGFPVSAMLAFRTFVRPLLAKLVGASEPLDPTVTAILKEKITGTPGHRTFVRVRVSRVKDAYVATPLKAQQSSMLTSMVDANGIVNVSESAPIIEAGTEVSVTLTGDLRA
jgi:molybdenum cofactor synthesis domain-containing protein